MHAWHKISITHIMIIIVCIFNKTYLVNQVMKLLLIILLGTQVIYGKSNSSVIHAVRVYGRNLQSLREQEKKIMEEEVKGKTFR